MAKLKTDVTLKLQTTQGGDLEEKRFQAGDEVHVAKEWLHHYLVRDADGHYYNVKKELIEK